MHVHVRVGAGHHGMGVFFKENPLSKPFLPVNVNRHHQVWCDGFFLHTVRESEATFERQLLKRGKTLAEYVREEEEREQRHITGEQQRAEQLGITVLELNRRQWANQARLAARGRAGPVDKRAADAKDQPNNGQPKRHQHQQRKRHQHQQRKLLQTPSIERTLPPQEAIQKELKVEVDPEFIRSAEQIQEQQEKLVSLFRLRAGTLVRSLQLS